MRALNPAGALPFAVTGGQLVAVTQAVFQYRGPAAQLQLGAGWKPGPADFNNGDNLYSGPHEGFDTGKRQVWAVDFFTGVITPTPIGTIFRAAVFIALVVGAFLIFGGQAPTTGRKGFEAGAETRWLT